LSNGRKSPRYHQKLYIGKTKIDQIAKAANTSFDKHIHSPVQLQEQNSQSTLLFRPEVSRGDSNEERKQQSQKRDTNELSDIRSASQFAKEQYKLMKQALKLNPASTTKVQSPNTNQLLNN